VPLLVGLTDRLAHFSARPEYRSLRAEDKKAVIDFRREVFELRRAADLSMVRLRRSVEGFSKFLESMSAINHREVLVLHDRRVLEESLGRVQAVLAQVHSVPDQARRTCDHMVEELVSVYGRNPDLDAAIRTYRSREAKGAAPDQDAAHFMPLLQQALATVG